MLQCEIIALLWRLPFCPDHMALAAVEKEGGGGECYI